MATVALKLILYFVINSLLIGCATEINGHFCEKILLFVRDWGGEITTQRLGAILGKSEKVGKH